MDIDELDIDMNDETFDLNDATATNFSSNTTITTDESSSNNDQDEHAHRKSFDSNLDSISSSPSNGTHTTSIMHNYNNNIKKFHNIVYPPPCNELSLYYLPLRARAEPIRMMLYYSNIPFNDITVTMLEWTNGVKENTTIAPFGQLPSLVLPSGLTLAQSGSINRYVSKICNLIPPNDYDNEAWCDMIYEFSQEFNLINPLVNFWPTLSDLFDTNYNLYFEKVLPLLLERCNELYKKAHNIAQSKGTCICSPCHPCHQKYVENNKHFFYFSTNIHPCHGDFSLFHFFDLCLLMRSESLDDYPELLEYYNNFLSIPAIKKYMEDRLTSSQVGMCGSYMSLEVGMHFLPLDHPHRENVLKSKEKLNQLNSKILKNLK